MKKRTLLFLALICAIAITPCDAKKKDKTTPEQKYLICGYADKYTGTVARNIWLAEHRSKNVYKILTEEFGVPASQLVLDDKGGVDNMYYDDPQLSRSAIISKYEE